MSSHLPSCLQAPQEEADAIIKEHCVVPRLVVCNVLVLRLFSFYSILVCSLLDLNTAFSVSKFLCGYLFFATICFPYWIRFTKSAYFQLEPQVSV